MNAEPQTKPCPVCKAPMEGTLQDYVVTLDEGDDITMEDVPMWLCEQCGYSEIEEEVAATIEDMLEHISEMLDDATRDAAGE
ncbi:MAG: YgiT-type zinc finger protein [Anaerolineae bacterium]|nr:YgiT-type zinc finger protein [Anaerolineae bacterium]